MREEQREAEVLWSECAVPRNHRRCATSPLRCLPLPLSAAGGGPAAHVAPLQRRPVSGRRSGSAIHGVAVRATTRAVTHSSSQSSSWCLCLFVVLAPAAFVHSRIKMAAVSLVVGGAQGAHSSFDDRVVVGGDARASETVVPFDPRALPDELWLLVFVQLGARDLLCGVAPTCRLFLRCVCVCVCVADSNERANWWS